MAGENKAKAKDLEAKVAGLGGKVADLEAKVGSLERMGDIISTLTSLDRRCTTTENQLATIWAYSQDLQAFIEARVKNGQAEFEKWLKAKREIEARAKAMEGATQVPTSPPTSPPAKGQGHTTPSGIIYGMGEEK